MKQQHCDKLLTQEMGTSSITTITLSEFWRLLSLLGVTPCRVRMSQGFYQIINVNNDVFHQVKATSTTFIISGWHEH